MLKFAVIIKFLFIVDFLNFKSLKSLIFNSNYNKIKIYKYFYKERQKENKSDKDNKNNKNNFLI